MAGLPDTHLIINKVEAILTQQVENGIPRQELRYGDIRELLHKPVARVLRLPSVRIACRWDAKRFAHNTSEIGAVKV